MPISQLDLAKFQEYKARQKIASHSVSTSANSQNPNSQNPNSQNPNSQNENGKNIGNQGGEKLPDLISWCVEDIVGQIEETEDFLELDNEQKANFEINLRIEFIDDFINKFEMILYKNIKMRIEFLKIGKKIENLQQIIEIINEIILRMPATRNFFFKTIKEKYLNFCTELMIINNSQIVFSY